MSEPGTIQYDIDKDYQLTAYHERINPLCSHFAELDLIRLRDRLGPGFNIVDRRDWLLAHLRCTRCGERGRNMTITVTPRHTGGDRPPS